MFINQKYYARLLSSAGCLLLLSACRTQGIAPPPQEKILPAGERAEEILHDSQAPEIVETGSLLPVERLLSHGILDIGEREAPLTLLVFTEHHCNYCEEFNSEYFTRLLSDFVQPGKLRIQLASFPLKKYPQSENAAKAVLCAARQNKGLTMNNLLFERVYKDPGSAKNYAKELEMDIEAFDACMENEWPQKILLQQQAWAQSLDVRYVPTFFLNGEKFVGLPYYADLRGRIEETLRQERG